MPTFVYLDENIHTLLASASCVSNASTGIVIASFESNAFVILLYFPTYSDSNTKLMFDGVRCYTVNFRSWVGPV